MKNKNNYRILVAVTYIHTRNVKTKNNSLQIFLKDSNLACYLSKEILKVIKMHE